MVKSRNLNNRNVNTAKGKVARQVKKATGKKAVVANAATSRRRTTARQKERPVKKEHASKSRTTKAEAEMVKLYRLDPGNPAAPREERQVKRAAFNRGRQKFTDDGWYSEDEAPTVKDIDPDRMMTILRKSDNVDQPIEQKVITHGEWADNHDQYASDGWYREDEQHSGSKVTDTVTGEARNTRTE